MRLLRFLVGLGGSSTPLSDAERGGIVTKRQGRLTRVEKIAASKRLGRNLTGKSDAEIRRLLEKQRFADAKKTA